MPGRQCEVYFELSIGGIISNKAQVKTLQQSLAAAAKTPTDKSLAATMADARPKIWSSMARELVQHGHLNDAGIHSHKDILESFHRDA